MVEMNYYAALLNMHFPVAKSQSERDESEIMNREQRG
jgi:hypothetical protein